MKKSKLLLGTAVIMAGLLLTTGCGKTKLKNGEEVAIKVNGKNITADTLYNELRKKMANVHVNFIQGDIFNDEITGTYDNIILSNLSSYYGLDKMRKLFDKMLESLNENGKMMIAYLYETTLYSDDYMEGEAEIYNIPKVIKAFPSDIEFNSFVGVRGLSFKSGRLRDSVITYQKVKKM